MKISIRGVSCSGKTTLAKLIAKELGIPHIELDELFWLPNWEQRALHEFLNLVQDKLEKDSWVMDGNYSKVYNNLKIQYDYQIWLDYSLLKILLRYFKRTFDRVFFKRKICNGNTETIRSLFSSDALLIWIFKTYWKRKRELSKLEKKGVNNLIIIKKEGDIKGTIEFLRRVMQ
ncbi:adenylate kinase [bacterium]|nr:adenylate kinase [bacterium]